MFSFWKNQFRLFLEYLLRVKIRFDVSVGFIFEIETTDDFRKE